MIVIDVDMPDKCQQCPLTMESLVLDEFGYSLNEVMVTCSFTGEPVGYIVNGRYESYVGDIRADDCPLVELTEGVARLLDMNMTKEETND